MKVLLKDENAGKIKLLVESIDDLWHLNHLIQEGDLAYALTYRREESQSDKLRSERGEKRRMYLGLEVETVEFHDFADRLRVHGTIKEGPQDIGS